MLGYSTIFSKFLRYITAKWFLGEEIPSHRVGSCPAAAADRNIFALATIVFIPFKIPKLKKKFRFFPDLLKWRCFYVSG